MGDGGCGLMLASVDGARIDIRTKNLAKGEDDIGPAFLRERKGRRKEEENAERWLESTGEEGWNGERGAKWIGVVWDRNPGRMVDPAGWDLVVRLRASELRHQRTTSLVYDALVSSIDNSECWLNMPVTVLIMAAFFTIWQPFLLFSPFFDCYYFGILF